jgi:hypothetical protein
VLPASVGAVFAFLLLVAPGIAYELTRQRRRPSRTDSAFVEASRVLLAGTSVALVTLCLLSLTQLAGSGLMASPGPLIDHPGSYAAQHPGRLLATAVAYLTVAVTVAVLSGDCQPYAGSRSRIVPDSAWFLLLDRYAPDGAAVYVSLTMSDGSAYMGIKTSFTSDPELKDREIVLREPLYARPAGTIKPIRLDPQWQRLILPGQQITSMAISYVATNGETPNPERRANRLIRARHRIIAAWRRWSWWQVTAVALLVELLFLSVLAASLPQDRALRAADRKGPPSAQSART